MTDKMWNPLGRSNQRDLTKKNLPREIREQLKQEAGNNHERAVPYKREHINLKHSVMTDGLGEELE